MWGQAVSIRPGIDHEKRMGFSKPNLVRLLGAVAGLTTAVWFVVFYSRFSAIRFEVEHPGLLLMNGTELMYAHGHWLLCLPVLALTIGLWILISRPMAATAFEIVLAVSWLVALLLVLICALEWQAQNIPEFHLGHREF